MTSSLKSPKIAWAFDEQGLRNIYVAESPEYSPRKLTNYMEDTGQELSSVSISADGNWIVYIRGGDFGSNWDDELPVNPTFDPFPPKVQIWSFPFSGGNPILIDEGVNPVISPKSDKIAYIKSGQLWISSIDGQGEPEKLFHSRGKNGSQVWSPDGSKIAFRSNRGDRSFIGVYENKNIPLKWIDPSYDRDSSPRWSPNGNEIVFIRQPGAAGKPNPILGGRHVSWKIIKGDIISFVIIVLQHKR